MSAQIVSNEQVERLANVALAVLLLIPAGILMLPIYIAHLLTPNKDGPFLYRGKRMGWRGALFTIYKIRSLRNNMEEKIGATLHTHDARFELWYGRFIRNSRIDELPQLFNIIRGDMDFVGPRPVRPIVYEKEYRLIPGFNKRFEVRPGLTGYSQFYTPHSSPKRMRALIDNLFIRRNVTLEKKFAFVLLTGFQFLIQIIADIVVETAEMCQYLLAGKTNRDRRRFRRRQLRNIPCSIKIPFVNDAGTLAGTIADMNHEAMLLRIPDKSAGALSASNPVCIDFVVRHKKNGRIRTENIRCTGTVLYERTNAHGGGDTKCVIAYTSSGFDEYRINKYLLKRSFSTISL